MRNKKPPVILDLFLYPVIKHRRIGGSLLLTLVLLLLAQLPSYADDVDRGEALHQEHCQRCHQSDIYNKPDRKVEDLVQLKQRVKQCELVNDLLWFEEEVNDVTAYLNTHFYLFGIK
jgi:mono/diheme cytochrome c family protein